MVEPWGSVEPGHRTGPEGCADGDDEDDGGVDYCGGFFGCGREEGYFYADVFDGGEEASELL